MGTQSTHAPGPWTLEREVWVNKLGMGDDHACQEIHHNGTTLGYWVDCEWSGWSPNARLIAAAPGLLAACKKANAALCGSYPGDHLAQSALSAIRAAIARAEGGAA